jgi:hypothetical protein
MSSARATWSANALISGPVDSSNGGSPVRRAAITTAAWASLTRSGTPMVGPQQMCWLGPE